MRNCSKCKELKPWSEFNKASKESSGYQSCCRICVKKRRDETQYEKIRYQKNKKEQIEKVTVWRKANPEKTKLYARNTYKRKKEERYEEIVAYREKNKEHKKIYNRNYEVNRKKVDPIFKLKRLIRSRLNEILNYKSWKKGTKFNEYIGCTQEELKQHLESKFQPGMTWENHGFNTWHIDHIIPLSFAKNAEEMYKLNHYTNLQPLWAKDNMSKGGIRA